MMNIEFKGKTNHQRDVGEAHRLPAATHSFAAQAGGLPAWFL